MTRKLRRTSRRSLLWAGGADPDTLALCPYSEVIKIMTAGGAVFTTAMMASLAATYTTHAILRFSLVLAIGLGVVWGLAIMNLDRYVLTHIRRQRHWYSTILFALPRVLVALLAGFVIAEPLVLRAFSREISAQVLIDHNAQEQSAKKQLDSQFSNLQTLETHATNLQNQIDYITSHGGRILFTNPLYREYAERFSEYQAKAASATTSELHTRYQRTANRILDTQMLPLRATLLSQQQGSDKRQLADDNADLTAVRQQIAAYSSEKQFKVKQVRNTFGLPFGGLADQIEALSKITQKDPAVGTVRDLLWAFFMAIDLMPALIKLMLVLGAKGVYERIQDAREEAMATAGEKFATLNGEEWLREATEGHEMRRQLGQKRMEKQVAAQGRIDDAFIDVVEGTVTPEVEGLAYEQAMAYSDAMRSDAEDELAARRGPREAGRRVDDDREDDDTSATQPFPNWSRSR